MTIKARVSSSQVSAKLLASFPAQVLAGTGIRIDKDGLAYTFSWDVSGIATSVSPSSSSYILGNDGTAFFKTTIANLLAGSVGTGTVTSVSIVTANGVSGSVATATSTPAITLTLGAITPSSINVSGLTASSAVATDGSKNLVSVTNTGTGNNVLATAPTIVGGSITALTAFGIRSTGAAFDLTFASSEVLTAGRALSFNVGDGARTLTLSGNLNVTGGTAITPVSSGIGTWSAGTLSGSNTPALGASGTATSLTFANATSGTIVLQPVTGALGTVTLYLPATTGTIALTSDITAAGLPPGYDFTSVR